MVVLVVLGAGVAAAGVVALLARRWPAVQAPRVSDETIVAEVQHHPKLADHLRRHFNPKTETGVALTAATALVVGAAVAIGVLIAMIRTRTGLEAFDLRFARYGAQHATSGSTRVMRLISQLGGTTGVVVLAAVVTVAEYMRRHATAIPLFMTLVVGGQFALSNGIKFLVERARPDISRLTGFAGTSFPSGHSTAASATLAAVALLATRDRSRRMKIAGASIAAGAAVLVAFTRVFLGVHWFTDVVAGLLLGWGWFALCSIAFGGRLLIFGLPVLEAEAVANVTGATGGPVARSSVT